MTALRPRALAPSRAAELVPTPEGREALGRLTDLAARLLTQQGAPLSVQVSLLGDVQTVAAGTRLAPEAFTSSTPLSHSLCTVTAATGRPLVVTDAPSDDRVAALPPVTSGVVGAYLGVPLVDAELRVLGGVCAFGRQPRTWADGDVLLLELVAEAVLAQLELQAATAREASGVRAETARLLDTLAAGWVELDRDFRVRRLNGEARRQIGAGDVVGQVLWDVLPGLEHSAFGAAYRRALVEQQVVEVEGWYPHLDGWFHVRAVPTADGLSLSFLDVTGRYDDQAQVRDATARLELLATVSQELAAAGLETEAAVARLARLCTPVLADWSMVSLASGPTQVRDVGQWHHDPVLRPVLDVYVARRLLQREDRGAVEQARDSREAVVVPSGVTDWVLPMLGDAQAREAWLQLGTESIVVVPMLARGSLTGVLTLCRGADRPPMTEEEVTAAREIASRAALALDNARLYAAQRSLAEGLQRSLLTTPREPEHCQVVARYVPAAEVAAVGGDWFDSFRQPDGGTVLVIGDVSGHDTEAAAAMGQLRALLRGIAWQGGGGPAALLSGLDAAVQGLEVATTATAVVARLDPTDRGGTLRWSNAGHPPPMVLGADGTVRVLAGAEPDLLLGLDPTASRADTTCGLERGDTLLLYTDGLVERRGQDLDDGLDLLERTLADLAGLPLPELCDALLARLLPPAADDDVALLAVRLREPGPSADRQP